MTREEYIEEIQVVGVRFRVCRFRACRFRALWVGARTVLPLSLTLSKSQPLYNDQAPEPEPEPESNPEPAPAPEADPNPKLEPVRPTHPELKSSLCASLTLMP